jgi:imidazolonepropionase-like amidohydrolase
MTAPGFVSLAGRDRSTGLRTVYGRVLGFAAVASMPWSPCAAVAQSISEPAARQVWTGATLIDGLGGAPIEGARLVLEGGRIVCVSGPDGCVLESGWVESPMHGAWITPGLIDSHVHLEWVGDPDGALRDQRLRFALGITAVRDAGVGAALDVARVRAEHDDPGSPTPRLSIAGYPGAGYAERWSMERGAALVERLAALEVEAIKVKGPFDSDLWRQEVRAARALGLPFFGHYWGGPPLVSHLDALVDEGVAGLSHLIGMAVMAQPDPTALEGFPDPAVDASAFWRWEKNLWTSADTLVLDSIAEDLAGSGVWLEPLLGTEYYWGIGMPPPPVVGYLRRVPPSLGDLVRRRDPLDTAPAIRFPEPYARMQRFVQRFARAGGRLVAGTDKPGSAPIPGVDLHAELRLLGEAGLSPMQVLQSATAHAAVALARGDIGVLEAGRRADLLIFDEDPLARPDGLLRAVAVVKGGVVHETAELRRPYVADYDRKVREVWRQRAVRFAPLLLMLAVVTVLAVGAVVWRRRGARTATRGPQ